MFDIGSWNVLIERTNKQKPKLQFRSSCLFGGVIYILIVFCFKVKNLKLFHKFRILPVSLSKQIDKTSIAPIGWAEKGTQLSAHVS